MLVVDRKRSYLSRFARNSIAFIAAAVLAVTIVAAQDLPSAPRTVEGNSPIGLPGFSGLPSLSGALPPSRRARASEQWNRYRICRRRRLLRRTVGSSRETPAGHPRTGQAAIGESGGGAGRVFESTLYRGGKATPPRRTSRLLSQIRRDIPECSYHRLPRPDRTGSSPANGNPDRGARTNY